MSLDEQYLDFSARTSPIFAAHPRLESLRYPLFKDLLSTQKALSAKEIAKHWVRPFLRRDHTPLPDGPVDVLLWLEGRRQTNTDALMKVYHELTRRGVRTQIMSSNSPEKPHETAIQFQHPAHFSPPGWATKAWKMLGEVYPELRQPDVSRAFAYLAANTQGIYDELERLLAVAQPKVVMVHMTRAPGSAAVVLEGRARGALTLELQHGILQPFFTPLLTDFMVTWGESSNQTLIDLNTSPSQLLPLGSPRHDPMQPVGNGKARQSFLDALSLPDLPTLVFFSNGNDLVRNGTAPIEAAEWLEAAAAENARRLNIVIRLHPNEDGSLYANCPHLYVTKSELSLETTLEGCDIVSSLCSTVLFEGLLYCKPVWQLYADGWPELADNWRTGLAHRVASQKELAQMVERVLQSGAGDFIVPQAVDRVFANHGQASQIIADYVVNHLTDSRS